MRDAPSSQPKGKSLLVPSPRPWAAAALAAWREAGARGVVALPAGIGRAGLVFAAAATARRALIVVPTPRRAARWREAAGRWREAAGARSSGALSQTGSPPAPEEPTKIATPTEALALAGGGAEFDLLVFDAVPAPGGMRVELHPDALETLGACAAARRLCLCRAGLPDAARRPLPPALGPRVFELTLRADAERDVVRLGLALGTEERRAYAADARLFGPLLAEFERLGPRASWEEFVRETSRAEAGREALAAWRRGRRLLAGGRCAAAAARALLAAHRDARAFVVAAGRQAAYALALDNLAMPLTSDVGSAERGEALRLFGEGRLRALVFASVPERLPPGAAPDVALVVGGERDVAAAAPRVERLLRPRDGGRGLLYVLATTPTLGAAGAERRFAAAGRGAAAAS